MKILQALKYLVHSDRLNYGWMTGYRGVLDVDTDSYPVARSSVLHNLVSAFRDCNFFKV
jgi:hypothetical protein